MYFFTCGIVEDEEIQVICDVDTVVSSLFDDKS